MPESSTHRLIPLISSEAIKSALDAMAQTIDEKMGENPYIIIGILDGAKPTLNALRSKLGTTPDVREVKASSYCGTNTTGTISCDEEWGHIPPESTILVIDDILDTGITYHSIKKRLLECGAKKVLLAVTVDKPSRRLNDVSPDFCGFQIEDHFIVGFGMDYNGKYRELPYIATVEFDGQR